MLATNPESDLRLERPGNLPAIVHTTSFDQAARYVDQILAEGTGLYLLTGEPEIGKTTVLEYCGSRSDESVKLLFHKFRRIDADNLSALLNEAFGVATNAALEPQGLALRYFLKLGTLHSKGQRFVLVIDDVETIHSSGAELIKALLQMKAENEGLVTILLCGDTSLGAVLDKSYRWGIQKLIKEVFEMQPLGAVESGAFIDQIPQIKLTTPVIYKPKAKTLLYKASAGVPGKLLRLGNLAGKIAKKSDSPTVTPAMAKIAAGKESQSIGTGFSGIDWRWPAAALIVLLIPIVLWTQGVFQSEDEDTYSQVMDVEEKISSQPNSIVPAPQTETGNVLPDIAIVEDNIFIGDLSAPDLSAGDLSARDLSVPNMPIATEPDAEVVKPIQSPSYRLTIPGYLESAQLQFQGAQTRIPAQPL